MEKVITPKQLESIRRDARGDTRKIAAFKEIKDNHTELVGRISSEEMPIYERPTAEHIEQLKADVEAGTHEFASERLAYHEALLQENETESADWKNLNVVKSGLRQRLQSGELKKSDLGTAKKMATMNSTNENIALYTQVKRTLNESTQG